MPKSKDDLAAVDAYLAGLPDDEQRVLVELRDLVRAKVPGVRERISYGSTVIFARHRDLVGFAAQPKHLSFFIMNPALAEAMAAQIKRTHRVSGATVHFSAEDPLPAALVEAILNGRVQQDDEYAPTSAL
ncbi:MAG: DUF1801 domain-containing protein [Acidimicrobiia bacterium]|nr:DUF1801 domain-containing protein [Acidimicrobiia bacterium]